MMIRLCILILAFDSIAHAEDYQIIQGRKVTLEKSRRYIALKLNQGISAQSPSFTSAMHASGVKIRKSSLLQKKGILVITKPRSADGNATFTSSISNAATEIPVYTSRGTDLVMSGEIVVRAKPSSTAAVRGHLVKLGSVSDVDENTFLLTIKDIRRTLATSNTLSTHDGVESAEPNWIMLQPSSPGPGHSENHPNAPLHDLSISDTYFTQQWEFDSNPKKAAAVLELSKAWNMSHATNIVIAVLDEGVDTHHPDLRDKIVSPFNAITGKSDQDPRQWESHGTECAGVAAASTNNHKGIAGVGYDAKIMPVKIASRESSDSDWTTTPVIIASGIRHATRAGADILSNSWSAAESPIIEAAMDQAVAEGRQGRGAVVIFAAGNTEREFAVGGKGQPVAWPASLAATKTIITVSATNEWDELKTTDSSDGEDWWASNIGDEITVSAPGVHILSTTISHNGVDDRNAYVTNFNGTSSAAPHVAGIAALILGTSPNLSAAEVRERLRTTANPLGERRYFGAGRVNACKAVLASGCSL